MIRRNLWTNCCMSFKRKNIFLSFIYLFFESSPPIIMSSITRTNVIRVIHYVSRILRGLDWIFRGDTSQVWALITSPWVKIWKKITTTVLNKDENFLRYGFYCNRSHHGNVTTPLRFLFIFVFPCTRSSFFKKSLIRKLVLAIIASIMAKVEQILRAFSKYFETKF